MSECNDYELINKYAMKGEPRVSEEVTLYNDKEILPLCSATKKKQESACAFRHFPLSPSDKGVITVEASLILPMVILLCFSFMLFFQILTVQLKVQSAMEEVTKQLAVAEYFTSLYSPGDSDEGGSMAELVKEYAVKYLATELTAEFAGEYVIERVGREWLDGTLLKGGSRGLDFSLSLLSKEAGLVDLRVEYTYTLPVLPESLLSLVFCQRSVRRVWTGVELKKNNRNEFSGEPGDTEDAIKDEQEGEDDEQESSVYITKTGKVYHIFRDCSSLKRTVKTSVFSDMSEKRNDSGGKYYACEYCVRGDANVVVYYTPDGDRYHNSRTCGNLMRYVQEIAMSEAGGKPLCKICAKRQTAIDEEIKMEAA